MIIPIYFDFCKHDGVGNKKTRKMRVSYLVAKGGFEPPTFGL